MFFNFQAVVDVIKSFSGKKSVNLYYPFVFKILQNVNILFHGYFFAIGVSGLKLSYFLTSFWTVLVKFKNRKNLSTWFSPQIV